MDAYEGNIHDSQKREWDLPELALEDPVTGSTHSTLIPMWSNRLKKDKLVAKQLSARGGTLYCEMGERDVKISGEAVLYMSGEIMV